MNLKSLWKEQKKAKIEETNTSESWLQKTDIQRGKFNTKMISLFWLS